MNTDATLTDVFARHDRMRGLDDESVPFYEPPRYTEHDNGVTFPANLSIDAWLNYGERLHREYNGFRWRLGDWLAYGERKYGEMYAQALDDNLATYGSMRVAASVSSRIELLRRRNMPWSWHQAIAPLERPLQDAILAEAEARYLDKSWTRDDLRAAVRELRGLPDDRPARLMLPTGDVRVMAGVLVDRLGREAARALGEALMERTE